MSDWIEKTVGWWETWMDTAEKCTWDEYVGTLKDKLRAAHEAGCEHKAALSSARAACGEAKEIILAIARHDAFIFNEQGLYDLAVKLGDIAAGKEAK